MTTHPPVAAWGWARPRSSQGFTLTELLATLAVMAILTAMALPNFVSPLVGLRLSTVASEFADTLSMARSEAQRQRAVVVICPRAISGGCNSGASNWNQGWFMFVDANANGSYDAGETVVQVHGSLDTRTTMAEASSAPIIKMDPTGATIGMTSGARTLKLTDPSSSTTARYVVLGRAGRARTLTDTECNTSTNGCIP